MSRNTRWLSTSFAFATLTLRYGGWCPSARRALSIRFGLVGAGEASRSPTRRLAISLRSTAASASLPAHSRW